MDLDVGRDSVVFSDVEQDVLGVDESMPTEAILTVYMGAIAKRDRLIAKAQALGMHPAGATRGTARTALQQSMDLTKVIGDLRTVGQAIEPELFPGYFS